MNNIRFEKTMETLRKRANIEIITSDEERQKIFKNQALHLKSYLAIHFQ